MRRCQVDVACRVIVGEDVPDFRTISDFRKIHLARLEALFVEGNFSIIPGTWRGSW
jgi:transposase